MIAESQYQDYFNFLITSRKDACAEIVKAELARQTPIKEIYTGLFQRSMVEIGSLWEQNRISVATEHMATAITERLLHLLYPTLLQSSPTDRKAIIACCADEYHQLGAKITADFFEGNGWDTIFLGANTPKNDLICMIDQQRPDLIGLSLSISHNLPMMIAAIEAVLHDFPNLDILIGGQAFSHGGAEHCLITPQVTHVDSLNTLEQLING